MAWWFINGKGTRRVRGKEKMMEVEPVDAYDRYVTESGYLHLSMRRLYHIPQGVFRKVSPCANLIRLDLSFNHLRTLPGMIANLGKLEELWLNDNPLESIPEGLAECKRLRVLDLADTRIVELPDKIGTLQDVQQVNLDRIETLAKALSSAYERSGTSGVMEFLKWSYDNAALKAKVSRDLVALGVESSLDLDCEERSRLVFV